MDSTKTSYSSIDEKFVKQYIQDSLFYFAQHILDFPFYWGLDQTEFTRDLFVNKLFPDYVNPCEAHYNFIKMIRLNGYPYGIFTLKERADFFILSFANLIPFSDNYFDFKFDKVKIAPYRIYLPVVMPMIKKEKAIIRER